MATISIKVILRILFILLSNSYIVFIDLNLYKDFILLLRTYQIFTKLQLLINKVC